MSHHLAESLAEAMETALAEAAGKAIDDILTSRDGSRLIEQAIDEAVNEHDFEDAIGNAVEEPAADAVREAAEAYDWADDARTGLTDFLATPAGEAVVREALADAIQRDDLVERIADELERRTRPAPDPETIGDRVRRARYGVRFRLAKTRRRLFGR